MESKASRRKLSPSNVLSLYYMILRGGAEDSLKLFKDHEDPYSSFEDFTRRLNKIVIKLFVPNEDIENALYAAQMLEEKGKFKDLLGRNKADFEKALLRTTECWDPTYCQIKEKLE